MKAIERRLAVLRQTWNDFIASSDEREAQQYLDAGASPDVPWEQWPAPLLALLGQMGRDPADIAESLRVVLARRADRDVIKIVWLDRMPASWEEQPTLIIQPGYIDMLRADPEPRVTTMPMAPAERKRFGDEGVQLIVSYTDKTPHNAPGPPIDTIVPPQPAQRPQPTPQTTAQPAETPYSFERAKASTERLARQQARTNRRLHVR